MADRKVNRQLSIFINEKEVVNSLTGITRAMRTTTNQLNNLNAASETYDQDVAELTARMRQLTEQQAAFREELYSSDKALGTAINSLDGVKQRMKEVEKELNTLDASHENYNERLEALGNEYRDLHTRQQQYTNDIATATRVQNVNRNSLAGIEEELGRVKNEMRQLDTTSGNFRQELARLRAEEENLEETQREINREINGFEEELTAAGGALAMFFGGLRSGNLAAAATGFTAIRTAIVTTTKAAMAFVATPVGATIAALATIYTATKEWFDYNKEATKTNQILGAITKQSGAALNAIRINSKALAETFDKDATEIASTAAGLVEEFDITYAEAFKRIEDGFIKGGAASDEFLESLQEYDVFFAQAGYSAEEFQNLLNSGFDMSIFQDKLPDAIKELGLAIEEQTDAARDALTNAFGSEFTDTLLKGVKNGSISVKDALFQISAEAKRVGLNSQQAAQLTADLFKGAGEDAGGAKKVFEALVLSIENAKRPLSEIEEGLKEVSEAEKEVAQAQERAFGSESFASWEKNFSLFFSTVKREFYDFIFVLQNGQAALDKKREEQRKADSDARVYESNLKNYKEFLDGQKKALGDRYDFEAAKAIYLSVIKEKYANAGAGSWGDVSKEDEELQKRLEAQMKVVEEYEEKTKKSTNKNSLEAIKAQEEANKKLAKEKEKAAKDAAKAAKEAEEKEAKEAIDRAKALASSGLDLYIANHQSKIGKESQLTDEIVKEEVKRLEGIKDASIKELAIASGSNDLIIALKQSQSVELNAMDLAYLSGKKNLEAQTEQEIANIKTRFLNQEFENNKRREESQRAHKERLLALEQETDDENIRRIFTNAEYLAEFELEQQRKKDIAKLEAAEEAAEKELERQREFELQKAEIAGASEEQLHAIRTEFERQKVESNDQTQAEIAATNKKYDEAQKKTGVAMLDFFIGLKNSEKKIADMTETEKLALTKQGLNMAAEMTNKGSGAWKALKIAEVTIATAQAAVNAYQSLSGIPIVGPALGAVAAGVVVAYGAKQVSTISKTKMEKQPKFFFGGDTGDTAIGYDEYGKITGIVHDGEYVIPKAMRQQPEVARTVEWLEAKRTGAIGGATGGSATTSPPSPANATAANQQDGVMLSTLQAILFQLQNPIAPNLVVGYKEVEDINKMSNEITASGNYGQLNN